MAAEFATSQGIERLGGQGWVTRRPNPADRRSSLLVLTDAGRLGELITSPMRALSEPRAALEHDGIGTPMG